MLPLAVLMALVVSLSAPLAFLAVRLQEYRQQARSTAARIAEQIQRAGQTDARLWRYDTPKLMEHLEAYRGQLGVRFIAVTDRDGALVHAPGGLRQDRAGWPRVLWGRAPIGLGGQRVGDVWVGTAPGRGGGLLLLGFVVLGVLLGLAVYHLPLRSIRSAEARIHGLVDDLQGSRRSLAELNAGLEQTVADRSRELRQALAEREAQERALRSLSARALALQESQQRSLARELHDEAGQALTALRLQLQLLPLVAGEPPRVAELARQATAIVDETLEGIRRVVRTLGPAILDDVGLARAVRQLGETYSGRAGVEVQLDVEADLGEIPGAVETACYRILQEALTNVARHAAARRVRLRLAREADQLVLEVEDDGCGLPPEGEDRETGSGLRGMQERALLIGGELEVRSAPGQGTTLRLVVYLHP
jgi:signal transduction histidine kinase